VYEAPGINGGVSISTVDGGSVGALVNRHQKPVGLIVLGSASQLLGVVLAALS